MNQSNDQNFQSVERQPPTSVVDERMRKMIAGAVAEVDPAQIAILRTMTPAERFQQAVAMIAAAESAGAYRLRQQQPHLNEEQALVAVRRRGLALRASVEERWRKNV